MNASITGEDANSAESHCNAHYSHARCIRLRRKGIIITKTLRYEHRKSIQANPPERGGYLKDYVVKARSYAFCTMED